MSLQAILDSDWSDYDDRKKRNGGDSCSFACTEPWEVYYLMRKIQRNLPQYTETAIQNAITFCRNSIGCPCPRERFISCLVKELLRTA